MLSLSAHFDPYLVGGHPDQGRKTLFRMSTGAIRRDAETTLHRLVIDMRNPRSPLRASDPNRPGLPARLVPGPATLSCDSTGEPTARRFAVELGRNGPDGTRAHVRIERDGSLLIGLEDASGDLRYLPFGLETDDPGRIADLLERWPGTVTQHNDELEWVDALRGRGNAEGTGSDSSQALNAGKGARSDVRPGAPEAPLLSGFVQPGPGGEQGSAIDQTNADHAGRESGIACRNTGESRIRHADAFPAGDSLPRPGSNTASRPGKDLFVQVGTTHPLDAELERLRADMLVWTASLPRLKPVLLDIATAPLGSFPARPDRVFVPWWNRFNTSRKLRPTLLNALLSAICDELHERMDTTVLSHPEVSLPGRDVLRTGVVKPVTPAAEFRNTWIFTKVPADFASEARLALTRLFEHVCNDPAFPVPPECVNAFYRADRKPRASRGEVQAECLETLSAHQRLPLQALAGSLLDRHLSGFGDVLPLK